MRKHLPLYIILAAFTLLSSFLAFHNETVWWDSAVYGGVGKHLWSFGQSGFMEPSRPLILPILLGFFWKFGVNELIAANVIAILFSIGTIIITYALGNRLQNGNTGILAALFMALSHTFLFFSTLPLTEIPSTFFLMFGIWFFYEKKYASSGALMGLAFLTRFFQALFIVFFLIVVFFYAKNRKNLLTILKGMGMAIAPYVLLSWALFGNPLTPFIIQFYLSMNTGVIYSESAFFYVAGFIQETFLILTLLALPFVNLTKEMKIITVPTLLTFITYSFFSHKEMRLLLVILPLISIITAYCAVSLHHLSSKWNKGLTQAFSISLIAFWFVLSFAGNSGLFNPNDNPDSQEGLFQAYMKTHEDKEFWISSPKYALHSDAKVSGLMYYPLVFGTPDAALVNSCDFLGNNDEYTAKTDAHITLVENTMENTYTAVENGCTYRIFEKTTSLS